MRYDMRARSLPHADDRRGRGAPAPGRAAAALALAAGCLFAALPAGADVAMPGAGYFALTQDAPASPDAPAPKHLYMFGTPARWPGPIYWRYNDTGRPAWLSKPETIARINAAAAKWMAVCNVAIAQNPSQPETTTPPQTVNGTAPSNNENVIGWGNLSLPPNGNANFSGVTFLSSRSGALVDADTTFSTHWVTSTAALDRVAVHEFGHALGLAHSNVSQQVMSGPAGSGNPGVPPTDYTGQTVLQADDVQGCMCLYGPANANLGKGYLCELPASRDFGSVVVGNSSAVQSVTLRNAAASGNLTVNAITFSSADFHRTSGCAPGTVLGPGASCDFGIVFSPVGGAGERKAFVQIGTSGVGPYAFPLTGNAVGGVARNYQGLWWNAPAGSEPGWGINFAHQGDTIFATWFTYDVDGSALWMVVAATRIGPDTYSGTLYRGTGPSYAALPFDPAVVVGTPVGTATFEFSDNDNGTFTWVIGGATATKAITREVFGAPVPTCVWGAQPDLAAATNYQDLWWNAPAGSESGWGINLTHQGDTVFATWFTYRTDGKPWWLAVSALKVAPNVYSGSLYSGSGPPYSSAKFDAAKVVAAPVGTATFTFADGNHATFSYTVDGVARSKSITREVFGPPGTSCR